MFATLSERLSTTLSALRTKGRLSEADIDATSREIRTALLEADVALPVVKEMVGRVKERALAADLNRALNPAQQVIGIVHEELIHILGGETRRIRMSKKPPTVILLAGLQGAGKTTLAGKLALWLKNQSHTPLLVAADLQRPNAVTQLQIVGERAGIAVFAPEPGNGVGDPVAVARDAMRFAEQKLHDIVIVDTAGRLGVDQEMMEQAISIRNAVNPDEILFVVDAMVGQDAVNTAQAFLDGVGFDAVVLTKLDGDARGGAALSIATTTQRPIMFASNGERLEDFDLFHPERMAQRILGMGDVATLIEQAERAFDAEQAAKYEAKFKAGDDFTLDDFMDQLKSIRKMGSISSLMGMLPMGMGKSANKIKEQIQNFDERELDRVQAIVHSMTPQERRDLKVLNGSRRARIAAGSGTKVSDVNSLVERFTAAQKMMKQMPMGAGAGLPQMPAMGMPGAGMAGSGKKSKGKVQSAPKKKSRSGNPAKRAQEER